MFSEFHIKRDASYLEPASVDTKDIYNRFEEPILRPTDLNIEGVIHKYFKACPPHQDDSKIGHITLNDNELHHAEDQDRIQMPNIDIALQAGYPNLYQHIHLHQQATDAINFKITSTLLLGPNDKLDGNWKREHLSKNLYLVAIFIKVDEPRTRSLLRPYRRESSQHQEFELNQPASTPPLHISNVGQHLTTVRHPTRQNIFDKINNHAIRSSHLFDQTSISGPLNSNAHNMVNLCSHETIWSKARHHIATYFPHMLHIVKWQEQATSKSKTIGGTSSGSGTSTLTTNIVHSKRATITKYSDDMDVD